MRFQANAQKVNFNGLTLNDAKGALQMKKGKLNMQNTGFNLIGCDVNMNANYQGITSKKAQFEYDIKATDFDVKKSLQRNQNFQRNGKCRRKSARNHFARL